MTGWDENGRGRRRSRGSSGLAAICVAFLAVLVWWWFGGNGPMTPETNSERLAAPDVELPSTAAPEPPQQPLPDTVPVQGFELATPTRLVLTFTVGTPECVGSLRTPEVLEGEASVVVTLRLDPSARPDGPCRDIALVETVAVDLDVPLGDRSVLDGSLPRAQRVAPLR